MFKRWNLVGWMALALMALSSVTTGCSGPDVQYADGRIAATVMGTRPIVGAEVKIWEVFQGERSPEPVATAVTDGAGRFDVHIGVAYGQILIETFGGTTEELISGDALTLEAGVRFAAVLPDFAPDEQREGLVISPMTTMAEALGDARLARGDKEADYQAAHQRALDLIGTHFGDVDLLLVSPADATEAVAGTLTPSARYGLVLAALSRLAMAIATESGATANVINSNVLAGALTSDLASTEALFDGMDARGPLVVGMCAEPTECTDEACSTLCDIGASTVRAMLANELERFVESTQNVTGLGLADITEMKLAIAKNREPELFGDAPIDGEGAPLTLDEDGFYVDPGTDVWWTGRRDPGLSGTVEVSTGETVTLTVEVNGTQVATGSILFDNVWTATLPSGALALAPATNILKVIATDGVGNRTVVQEEVRVDVTPPSIEYVATTVIDERQDTVDFGPMSPLPPVPPVQTHPGPSITLGNGGCPDIYKHVHLMTANPGDNRIGLRFRLTDDGVGIDPASATYRVDFQGGGTALGATTPDTATAITGGSQYEIHLTRANITALGTDATTFLVTIHGIDRLGQDASAVQCFVNHPLGPPLRTSNIRNGMGPEAFGDTSIIHDAKLTRHNLPVSNLAPLINGVPPGAGAGVMLFDVENPWSESVYFEVGWTQPSATRTKTWKRSALVSNVSTTNLDCLTNGANCAASWPYSEEIVTIPSASVPTLIGGTRVWDMTGAGPQPVNPCPGCTANRYSIPPGVGTTPRKYRVMLVATDLSPLHPGETDTGNFVEYAAGGFGLTGLNLTQTFNRCTNRDIQVDINGNITVDRCIQRTTYRRYLALTDALMTIQQIDAALKPSATATGTSAVLSSIAASNPLKFAPTTTWTTTETNTPPKPIGMP